MASEPSRPKTIQLKVLLGDFNVERLIALLLETTDFSGAWRSEAEIIIGHLPPHADERTPPKCVVKLRNSFLRHSKGPHQHYFWDTYGDDFLYPELALLALSRADVPHWFGK